MRVDLGLLFLRIAAAGTMLLSHGLGKLKGFSTLMLTFPDPIGLGPVFSLTLAVFAEVFCAGLVLIGFGTRLACLPLIVTMLVAVTVVHAGQPWAAKELAALYAVCFTSLVFTGPGMFSLDALLHGRMNLNLARP